MGSKRRSCGARDREGAVLTADGAALANVEPRLEELLRFLAGGAMIRMRAALALGRDALEVATKSSPSDLVTVADRSIEAWLWNEIHDAFPADGFLGEEQGWRESAGGRRWIVDPVDGTINFATGLPWACSSIGVVEDGRAIAGAIGDPYRQELYLTVPGSGGSELDGALVSVIPGASLAGRVVLLEVQTGSSSSALSSVESFVRSRGGTTRMMGSGALAMALVASGRAHAVVHAGPSIWDVAAGVALVENAGGCVLGATGPYVLGHDGPLVAANAEVAEMLRAAL